MNQKTEITQRETNKVGIEESIKSGSGSSGGDLIDLLSTNLEETKPILYRLLKGDEQILEDTVRLPVIETSHPKGLVIEKQEFLRRFVQLEKAKRNTNSRGIARAVETELLNLQPKGLSNAGLPETLEELRDMANSAEGKIDDILENDSVEINNSEIELLTLMSTIAENIRRLESLHTQHNVLDRDSKLKSIGFQQDVLKQFFSFIILKRHLGNSMD